MSPSEESRTRQVLPACVWRAEGEDTVGDGDEDEVAAAGERRWPAAVEDAEVSVESSLAPVDLCCLEQTSMMASVDSKSFQPRNLPLQPPQWITAI